MLSLRSFSRLRSLVPSIVRNQAISSAFVIETIGVKCPTIASYAHHTELRRNYAKNVSKQKEKMRNKGFKFANFHLTDEQLSAIVNVDSYKKKLQKAIDNLEAEFIKNLSLRSTTGSIDTIKVKYEAEEHELQDIAQIIRKNPKTIVVNMASFPQMIPAALLAIAKSGMNLNPQQEGTTIFIPVPKVTKDHRLALAKNAKALFIKCRDHIKDAQNEVLRKVKRNTEIPEDDNHSAQGQLTQIADEYVAQAEKMLETKQKELLGN